MKTMIIKHFVIEMSKVLIDTSVWSVVFRRKKLSEQDLKIEKILKKLILSSRVILIGPIRQELLSGISDVKVYSKLKNKFRVFPDFNLKTADYELAAEFSNTCRVNGIQGAHTDFLICAVAIRNEWEIFTTDNDFQHYSQYLPIKLFTEIN